MAYNTPDIESIQKTKEDLDKKIKELQEIGISNPTKTIWKNLIEPKLLTERQIAKKMLITQSQSFGQPISEEDAQLIIYGKIYYKNGKLYDNDVKDPACLSKPGDEDYEPPVGMDHPMIKNIMEKIKGLKESIFQLGIKIGEFLIALPAAIVTIATSLIALVSSAVVLPFGAGLPAALTAVMTMIATIKDLQAKTAALLPLIAIVDTIALILPSDAQAIIAQINVIYGILLGIIATLSTILGLLGKVTSALSSAKKKVDEQKLKLEIKAEPSSIKIGENSKLSATVTGGDWNYTYQWTIGNSTVISKESEVIVMPKSSTQYTCKIIDGTGTIKSQELTVLVLRS